MALTETSLLITSGLLGVAIGIGKLLITATPLSPRLVIGHALVGGVTSLAGLAVVAVIPALTGVGQIGVSCAASLLGTVYLEKLFNRLFNITPDK